MVQPVPQDSERDRFDELKNAIVAEQKRLIKAKRDGGATADAVFAELTNTTIPLLSDVVEAMIVFRDEVAAEFGSLGSEVESLRVGITDGESQLMPEDAEQVLRAASGLKYLVEEMLAGRVPNLDDAEARSKLQELYAEAEKTITLVNDIAMQEVDEDEEGEESDE